MNFIVEVFSEILKTEPDTKLILIGDGEERENIKNTIKKNNIADQVIFAGVRKDIDSVMSGLDILLLPSDFESLGIVLIEGQASGLYCIASSNVSREAKISNRIDYLDLHRKEWVNKIKTLNMNMDRDSSYKEAVKTGYDAQDSAIKMQELYRSILNHEV